MKRALTSLKRIVAVLVIFCLMFSLIPANTFAAGASDISGHWAQVMIQSWMDKGLIKGYPDGTFKPDQNVTRAEFMTLANRAFGYTTVVPITYTDVKAGSWYASEVTKAKAAGYISGYPDGTMKPENPITREETATIIARLQHLNPDADAAGKYTDASSISSWSKGQVGAVTSARIMQGYPDGSFMPQGLMTRAEVVVASDNALHYTAPVVNIAVRAITVTPTTIALTAGGATGAITATVSPSNATNKIVTWSSSNAAVATVAGGVVTPVAAGVAVITATTAAGSFTATCTVTVTAPVVSGGPAPTTYTVTFDSQGGTPTPAAITGITSGATVTLPAAPTKTGYAFASWNTAAAGTGSTFNESTHVTTNVTVYAQWTIDTFTLTYTAGTNGTITGTSPQTVGYGTDGAQVTATPSTGYHFVKWSDDSTANPRTDTNVTANISVAATFAANTYTVTFDGNGGGTPDPVSKSVTYDAAYGTLATVTKTGYAFNGWYTATTGGTEVTSATTVSITAGQTLYAQWTANSYTVTFDKNGGDTEASPASILTNYNTTVTLPTPPTKTGYAFSSWNTVAGGTGAMFGGTTPVTANVTVYAQWTINNYTLTYNHDANGTISGTTPQTVGYGADGTLVTAVPNAGYHFVKWSDNDSAVAARTDIHVTANISVAATFAANTYTVTFDGNGGGTPDPVSKSVTYDAAYGTLATVTKTGYAFNGWYTATTGGTEVTSATTVSITAGQTLYAQWLSSDATLKTSSTVKGQTPIVTGTGNATVAGATGGSVAITAAQAADVSNTGSYITLFVPTDAGATVSQVVKYAFDGSTAGFATDAAYENAAITDADFFIVKVTAQDTTTILYYKVIVTVQAQSGSPAFTAGTPATFGTQLTVGPDTLTTTTNLMYTWYRSADAVVGGDTSLTTGLTYTPIEADIANYLIVVATSTDATGTGYVVTAAVVAKADGPPAPSAPADTSYTATSVTLAVDVLHEFSRDAGANWQDSNVFTGLTPSTAYTFIARVKATATTFASVASTGTSITTYSNIATLSTSSTVKGQTVIGLGTPDAVLATAAGGTVTITAAQAADTSNVGSYITLFVPTNAGATVSKVVKYATGGDTTGFEGATAFVPTAAITTADFFIVKVTAQDTTTILYYKVVVTVTPAPSSDATITGGALEGVALGGNFIGGADIGGSTELTVTVFGGATDDILGLTKGNANSVINYVVGSGTPANNAAYTLTYGTTTINTTTTPTIIWLLVTAEDTTTKLYYKITATAASSNATVTSGTYTVSAVTAGAGTITNVPFGTAKATFLAALTKGQVNQTWVDTAIANPVVSTNTLVVTAQNGTTIVTYTVTTNAELSHDATLSAGTLAGVSLAGASLGGTGAGSIGSSSGLTVTVPSASAASAALVLTKGNENSIIKYVVLQSTGDPYPQPANDAAYTGIYTSGITFAVDSNTRIWLLVTAQDGTTKGYSWIIVSVTAPVEITAFDHIADVAAGVAGSATYANAAAVIGVLPVTATGNASAVTVPVTGWVDTDTYNPAAAGSYTFTATLGAIPAGFLNTGAHTATVEVVITAPVIATSSTIAVGAVNPSITITVIGTHFRSGMQLSDLTVNTGSTGVTYSGLSGTTTAIDIWFSGTAAAGNITIQAEGSAFNPASASASNILTITVAAPAAPTFVSAATSGATTIVITMSSALTGTAGAGAAFTVAGAVSNPTVTNVAVAGTSVTLTLSAAIVNGETITVAYAKTGTTDLTNGTLVADFAAQSVTNNVPALLTVGQSYGGGIVAYILQSGDPGYDATVQHGLIAATADQSTGIQWYNGSWTTTGATATAIGTGNANTNTIVTSQGAGSYAAQLCADLVLGSYSDWYLPSRDELYKLYLNQGTIGNFTTNASYWSSTEYDSIFAWRQFFNDSSQNYGGKEYIKSVRAVRTF